MSRDQKSRHITPMSISGAYRIDPVPIPDARGSFFELVRTSELQTASEWELGVRQVNFSRSRRDTVRGIHGTAVPPGQAKLVTCVRGAAIDIAIDIRVGSPTFGQFEVTRQVAQDATAVYLPDGLGHAFQALTDDTVMCYLCSTEYVPGTMIELDALDKELGLPWELGGPAIRSNKDAAAPTLKQAAAAGILPTYAQCPPRPTNPT